MLLQNTSHQSKIFVCHKPTDMRCGRYRLAQQVQQEIGGDPLSGHLYVFFNKRRTATKVLYFDGSGYAVWHKVLESGTYTRCSLRDVLSLAELLCILEGIEVEKTKRRKRFSLAKG